MEITPPPPPPPQQPATASSNDVTELPVNSLFKQSLQLSGRAERAGLWQRSCISQERKELQEITSPALRREIFLRVAFLMLLVLLGLCGLHVSEMDCQPSKLLLVKAFPSPGYSPLSSAISVGRKRRSFTGSALTQ